MGWQPDSTNDQPGGSNQTMDVFPIMLDRGTQLPYLYCNRDAVALTIGQFAFLEASRCPSAAAALGLESLHLGTRSLPCKTRPVIHPPSWTRAGLILRVMVNFTVKHSQGINDKSSPFPVHRPPLPLFGRPCRRINKKLKTHAGKAINNAGETSDRTAALARGRSGRRMKSRFAHWRLSDALALAIPANWAN